MYYLVLFRKWPNVHHQLQDMQHTLYHRLGEVSALLSGKILKRKSTRAWCDLLTVAWTMTEVNDMIW